MIDIPLLTCHMKRALELRHHRGIYIDEFACHVGKKFFSMDGWATEYGYDKDFVGYEIKATRSDFLRDKKWKNYLDFCHRFYFVCPKGLILPEELPNKVGLIYFNPERRLLRQKKRAVRTECHLQEKTWKYIMMQFARKKA